MFWSSAQHPTADALAVATSSGVMWADGPHENIMQWHITPSTTDVFAVEFLSEWTLAAGMRDGGIMILDRRVRTDDPPPLDMLHPGSITHIRSVDGVQIVVNGLEHSVGAFSSHHYCSTTTGIPVVVFQ